MNLAQMIFKFDVNEVRKMREMSDALFHAQMNSSFNYQQELAQKYLDYIQSLIDKHGQ